MKKIKSEMKTYQNGIELYENLEIRLGIEKKDSRAIHLHRIGKCGKNNVWSLIWSGIEGTVPVLIRLDTITWRFTFRRMHLSYTRFIIGKDKPDVNSLLRSLQFHSPDHCYVDDDDINGSTRFIYNSITEMILQKT